MTTTILPSIFEDNFLASIQESHDQLAYIINEIKKLNTQLIQDLKQAKGDQKKEFLIAKDYQNKKLDQFKQIYSVENTPYLSTDIEAFSNKLKEFNKTLPKKKVRYQIKDRFVLSSNDSFPFSLVKRIKILFYHLSIIPKILLNYLRKIFKKKIKKIPYWKYTIPYRSLVGYHADILILNEYTSTLNNYIAQNIAIIKEVIDQEQAYNKTILEKTLNPKNEEISKSEIKIGFDHALDQLNNNRTRFIHDVKTLFTQANIRLDNASTISGTIEFPKLYLEYQNKQKKKNRSLRNLHQVINGWGNTLFALLEDWKVDQEIYNLNYFSKLKIDELGQEYNEINVDIVELLMHVKILVSELKKKLISQSGKTAKTYTDIIQKELDKLGTSISKDKLSAASEQIINHNLPEQISHFELKVERFLKEIAEKRWLTKLTDYDEPIRSSDLNSFSPRELISYEYLPELKASLSSQKSKIVQFVERTNEDIGNIEHIVAFNLSSIIESVEKGDCKLNNIPQLIDEGMDRSQNKIDEVVDSIKKFEQEIIAGLNVIIEQFNNSTLKLTINENAFNLRVIVMKAKAIKKSEELGEQIWDKTKNLYKKAIVASQKKIEQFELLILPWKRRIGLADQKDGIATELSDFLIEVTNKIKSLPIIYQRLYKITPLAEMSLFTGRETEYNMLTKAYNSWKDGKYSPTVILGEKWSGHTTLINYFIDKHLNKKEVIYENRKINIEDTSEFYAIWQKILNEKELNSIDQVAAVIKKKYKRKVFILENLQNYYLRTIKGFEILHLLIKLIAKTYKEVFWLCSVNIYAWEYLNKTNDLSGHFGYEIKMNPFSDEELRELIMKKNNISGYKIVFTPSENNLNNKKFIKLNEDEKQDYLRKQFFKELNSFAKGNISLALSYWLLSTKKITEDSIEIRNFISPDFSFISSLSVDKAFIIYLLIMHDGLTFNHLCEVFKKPEEQLQLTVIMLTDDGILVEQDNWIEVNPLIYRHSINMLKSRNLIY